MRELSLPRQADVGASDSFRDAALALMAAVVTSDGFVLPSEFETYGRAADALLTTEALAQTRLRVLALRHLLRPPDAGAVVVRLAKALESDAVSVEGRRAIIEGLLEIVESSPHTTPDTVTLVRRLVREIDAPLGDAERRLEAAWARIPPGLLASLPPGPLDSAQPIHRALSALWSAWSRKPNADPSGTGATFRTIKGDANSSAREACGKLLTLGQNIGDTELVARGQEFLSQLDPQTLRIVLVGEMKHGKSSIFNLLLGRELSPTGEATATTSAVIEMKYSESPSYEGRWLGEKDLESLVSYIRRNEANPRVAEYGRLLEAFVRSGQYAPGGVIPRLDSLSALTEFVTVQGRSSCAVERIVIGLPLESLRSGAVIVDTPGINDPMRVRDHITEEEAKRADCVVFVMRADKFGTESERAFLLALLRAGRAVSLVVVLTHTDRLSSPAEAQRVVVEAKRWLRDVSDESGVPQAAIGAPIFAVDARWNQAGAQPVDTAVPGWQEFTGEIGRVAADPSRGGSYAVWVRERLTALSDLGQAAARRHQERLLATLPDAETIDKLTQSAERFSTLAESHRRQIEQRMVSIRERLDLERKHLSEDLERNRDDILAALRAEIEGLVRTFGEDYYREERWQHFDRQAAAAMARERMAEFLRRTQERQTLWQNEMRRFSEELELQVTGFAAELGGARHQFTDLCATNHFLTTVNCKLDATTNALASGAALIGGGYALVGLTTAVTTGNIALFTGLGAAVGACPPALLGGLGVAFLGLVAQRVLSNPEKRKMKFIEAKVDKARERLDEHFRSLHAHLGRDLDAIWEGFCAIAESRHSPLIEEALLSAEEARLRCEVSRRMRADVDRYLEALVR